MLNRLFQILYSALLLCVLISCSNDSFKIEGALSDAGKQTLKGLYVNEAGVQTVYAAVENSRFTFEGVSSNPTIFSRSIAFFRASAFFTPTISIGKPTLSKTVLCISKLKC